jgi:hypothetical protein
MMAINEEHDQLGPGRAKNVALSAVLGMLLLLCVGALAGVAAAMADGDYKQSSALIILASAIVVGAAAVWGIVRLKPWAGNGDPMSPKTRKANNLLFLSGALGGVLGAALAVSTLSLDDPFAMFSDSPIPPAVVIPALVVWLLIVPVISYQWHRNIDEHETEAYKFGGIAAIYLYLFLTPAWWFAWRGGLVPAPATMVIYMLVIGVFTIGWFWRRSR